MPTGPSLYTPKVSANTPPAFDAELSAHKKLALAAFAARDSGLKILIKKGSFMKALVLLASLLGAISVHAADKKIGNVIMIERDVENVYTRCIADLKDQDREKEQQFCALQITTSPFEVMMNRNGGIRYRTPNCQVDSDFGNGKMLVSFQALGKDATLADSKRCLQNAVNENSDIVATIQTVE
jgi:hypothetical protein